MHVNDVGSGGVIMNVDVCGGGDDGGIVHVDAVIIVVDPEIEIKQDWLVLD